MDGLGEKKGKGQIGLFAIRLLATLLVVCVIPYLVWQRKRVKTTIQAISLIIPKALLSPMRAGKKRRRKREMQAPPPQRLGSIKAPRTSTYIRRGLSTIDQEPPYGGPRCQGHQGQTAHILQGWWPGLLRRDGLSWWREKKRGSCTEYKVSHPCISQISLSVFSGFSCTYNQFSQRLYCSASILRPCIQLTLSNKALYQQTLRD